MLLAIDAGNTNIVFAIYDGDKMRAQWRAVTQVSRTSDEYAVWLSQLLALEGLSFKDLNQAIIATVVPAVLFDLRALCRTYLKCEPMLVGDPALDMGMKANVDRPQAVGADRLCNTVAAHERYPGAVIVVDFGTATNFDIVAENGDFDGSVIAPIDGLITRIKAEYGKPMTVVATGGLAHLFHPDIPAIQYVDPDLTMRGLMLIHARNLRK
jgi:type III pantothenate kinase